MVIKKCKGCPRTDVNHVPKQNIQRGTDYALTNNNL